MDRRGFFGVLGGIAAFPLVNKLLPKPKSRLLHTAGVVNEFRFRYSCPSTSAAEKIVLMPEVLPGVQRPTMLRVEAVE